MSLLLASFKDRGLHIKERVVPHDDHIVFSLTLVAHPGSKKKKNLVKEGVLHLYFNELPIEGRANEAIIKLLSKGLGVPKSAIAILKGEKSSNKSIVISYQLHHHKDEGFYVEKFINFITD